MGKNGSLRVMTYNLRNNSDVPPNSWEERRGLIQALIRREKPDIIGTQEGLHPQVKDMEELLPEYGWIGLGRDGGSHGEYMTIYYKKERLEIMEYDHFWLSDTPEKIGSTTWGNACTRMATWVRFFDKETRKAFYHLNTHLDHESELARVNGAKIINQKTEQFKPNVPIIITGDFNTLADSETHRTFLEEGQYVDTWLDAKERVNENLGTFNGFKNPSGGNGRIDWILYKGKMNTSRVHIVNDQVDGRFPSDHFPLVADLQFNENE
ncbi:endonuclease/exonuclease/phosphatase family protein [Lederbergia sp. NSJ-179]|uniref:endonuclease/exonuclease/phosphatase family protein n=1 Tax=Lederbergia sp. NSJ-179 TaxID=2931402 RepID=UPI001FD0CF32|nr:endonuclease/exonuclease/phosphatase family protein [Lederbergia sp. NSJ-179]MCJ7840980.1 endonuclease/exonuclease/phosphatase family protein [Lederbergia sp. NSJ-179]